MKFYWIVFFILFVDFVCLGEEVENVFNVGVDVVYFDVMDNYYVLNFIFGFMICEVLCNYGIKVFIDVYFMVKFVDDFISKFVDVGVSFISFYLEVLEYIDCFL